MPYKGGKRKKSRTHKVVDSSQDASIPKSFVLRRGKTDTSVKELVRDIRELMLPHTAERLRERKSNTLKDFVSIAGSLHVSHLLMFSQVEGTGNVNLRIGRLPRGPTLTFRVEQYTTTALLRSSQKRPVDMGLAFEHPPLVVLHNFSNVDSGGGSGGSGAGVSRGEALRMAEVTFKAMFPPLNPASVKLDHCKRVLLVHHARATGRLELRHYLVRAVPVGVTRGVKKLAVQSKLPDLSRLDDVASFVLSGGRTGGGQTSDSEGEDDAARVTLPQSFAGRGNERSGLSAIKLVELGPRLSLSLVKIEGGMCEGDVLYHAFVSKTEEEAAALKARAADRVRLKEERRATQATNVAAKVAAQDAKKAAKDQKRVAQQTAAEKAAAAGTLGEEDDAMDGAGAEEEGGYANDDDEEEEEEGDSDKDGPAAGPDPRMMRGGARVDVGDEVGEGEELEDDDEDEEEGEEESEEEEAVPEPVQRKPGGAKRTRG